MAKLNEKEQIRNIMLTNAISYAQLAKKLTTVKNESNLRYALEQTSGAISFELYADIMQAFENMGVVSGGKQVCKSLVNRTLNFNVVVCDAVKKFNNQVAKDSQDDVISADERLLLITRVKDMKDQVTTELNSILKTLGVADD